MHNLQNFNNNKSNITSNYINNNNNNKVTTSKSKKNFYYNFIIGGTSETLSKTIIAPIERTKILLQSQQTLNSLNVKYKGTLDCILRVAKEQGVISFWRGNMANIYKYVPTFAFNYSIKEYLQSLLNCSKSNRKTIILNNILSGFFAAGITLFMTYPLDFTRTMIAVDLSKKGEANKYKGIKDCFSNYYKLEGIKGIYSGFITAFIGISVYRGALFGFYDSFNYIFPKKDSVLFKYILSVIVSGLAGVVALPFDTIRRRLIVQVGKIHKDYNGTLDCIRKIYKIEGIKGFNKGGYANFFRSFGSALTLILNDYLKILHKNLLYK